MNFYFELILVGMILSADSFSAAIAMGFRKYTKKDALKFAFSSGGAEGIATLIGALAGKNIISKYSTISHWVGFLLLIGVAIHLGLDGIQSLRNSKIENVEDSINEDQKPQNFHSYLKILIVSFATSIDALGVGVGLGVMNKPILPFVLSIAFWAFISTILGLFLAKKLSSKIGPFVNILSAVILMLIAFVMYYA